VDRIGASEPTASDVASARARAVVASLGRAPLVPDDASYYATSGSLEIGEGVDRLDEGIARATAVIVNEGEARALTGAEGRAAVDAVLERGAASCVVTLGHRGAVAGDAADRVEVPAVPVDVRDVTGAGDLFVAAYVWADLAGLALRERVAWASLAAGLSLRAPTALDGAVRLDELLDEGADRGLGTP
jgi:sugar/nucleoside kinase (ribokinase family)